MATVDDIAETIKIRESGGNYTIKNPAPGATASGAYQYIDSTWQAEATKAGINWKANGWTSANMAPASVQDTVAKNNIQNILNANNGNIEAVPNVWYTGNAAGNMTAKQLAANGGQTSATYTQKWMQDYAKVTGGTYTTDTSGQGVVVDDNGKVIATVEDVPAPASSGFAVYTGAEQAQLIQSMQDLENFEANWEENVLDQSDDYIYNLELFLVDKEDVIGFMSVPAEVIENDGWPGVGQKKVVIAKTGETAEFVITDLVVDSISVGGVGNPNMLIANASTELSFNITRVGNARLGDAIQDAVAVAGYADVSSAYFFIKIKFTHVSRNGSATFIPNTTKVLPFRLKKVMDISTSTDNRGTAATLEGTIIRKHALQTPSVGQIKEKITSDVVKNSADATIDNFISKLNEMMVKNSYGVDSKYVVEYKYERDDHFKQKYSQLVIGYPETYRTGTGSGEAETLANPDYNTISIAGTTLEVQPTTNIIDVLRDILINTNEMRAALTTPNKTLSDLFSIEIDYVPKEDGYNILTRTEGATVTFRACLKEELIEHNTLNQIDQLTNINQTLQAMITTGRIKKKYYYYYTGKNDQIMQFDISLNNQLLKVQNEEYTVFFDVNQVNSLEDMLSATQAQYKARLTAMSEEFSRTKTNVQQTEAALESAKNTYAAMVDELKKTFIDGIISSDVPPYERSELARIIDQRFEQLDLYSADENGYSTLVDDLNAILGELGLSDELLNDEMVNSLDKLLEDVSKAQQNYNNAKAALSDKEAELNDGARTILGVNATEEWITRGGGDADTTFDTLGIASNIATLEDLGTDIRRKLTTTEVAGILNFLSVGSARFISAQLSELSGEKTDARLILTADQRKSELANIKYIEGWSQDLSMVNATMKIKGDPYWIENYLTSEKRNAIYQRNNYRPNNVSNVVGTNFIMVVSNTIDGVDNIDQPIVSNLFRYLYMVKSIKSEFSNGLFTQTLDMSRFTLADTYNYNPTSADSAASNLPNGVDDENSEPVREGVQPGESITVEETQIPIEETTPQQGPR